MSYVIRTICKCDRCGHEWLPYISDPALNYTPKRCAKCKSRTWNQPKQARRG